MTDTDMQALEARLTEFVDAIRDMGLVAPYKLEAFERSVTIDGHIRELFKQQRQQRDQIIAPDEPSNDPEWKAVEIAPRTPATAIAMLQHRHNVGVACAACEIIALRAELKQLKEGDYDGPDARGQTSRRS